MTAFADQAYATFRDGQHGLAQSARARLARVCTHRATFAPCTSACTTVGKPVIQGTRYSRLLSFGHTVRSSHCLVSDVHVPYDVQRRAWIDMRRDDREITLRNIFAIVHDAAADSPRRAA